MIQSRRGVTFVEMLVVFAIISVLLGLLLPAVQNARMAAKRAHCANNLRQIGIAINNHADANKSDFGESVRDPLRRSWRVKLLTFLEESALVNEYQRDQPWVSPANLALAAKMPRVFSCPLSRQSDGRASYESPDILYRYRYVEGTPASSDPRLLIDATKQRAFRPMATEVSDECAAIWLDPFFLPRVLDLLAAKRLKEAVGGNHESVFPVLFADGHVRFYSTSIDAVPLFEVFGGMRDPAELEQ